jgi:hypothetical protein
LSPDGAAATSWPTNGTEHASVNSSICWQNDLCSHKVKWMVRSEFLDRILNENVQSDQLGSSGWRIDRRCAPSWIETERWIQSAMCVGQSWTIARFRRLPSCAPLTQLVGLNIRDHCSFTASQRQNHATVYLMSTTSLFVSQVQSLLQTCRSLIGETNTMTQSQIVDDFIELLVTHSKSTSTSTFASGSLPSQAIAAIEVVRIW